MTVPSKSIKKMVVLLMVEATGGVDPGPTAMANAILVSDVTFTPLEGSEVERNNVRPTLGDQGSTFVGEYQKMAFSVEWAGAGTAGDVPAYAPIFRGSGCSVTQDEEDSSVKIAPVSNGHESVTAYGYLDGILHKMVDAKGELKGSGKIKDLLKWQFEFSGKWQPAVDAAVPAAVLSAFVKPVPMSPTNTTVSFFGTTLACSDFGHTAGNAVEVNDWTGQQDIDITARTSTANLTFKTVPVATKNWAQLAQQSATGALVVTHGTVPGNIVEFHGGQAQAGKPSYATQGNTSTTSMTARLTEGAAGDDDWYYVIR